jgi:hypothetical protein
MTDPAETHAELDADKRRVDRLVMITKQLEHLYAMHNDTGFGNATSNLWVERAIHKHLETAFQLLNMEQRSY